LFQNVSRYRSSHGLNCDFKKTLRTYFTILVSDCFAEVVVLAEMAGNVVLSEALEIVQPLRQPAGARYVHISKIIIRFANTQNRKRTRKN
jgi:hypothetical protein